MPHAAPLPLVADNSRRAGIIAVLAAGLFYASAGLFTRALAFDAWTLLAWRSLFAGLFLVGQVCVERRRIAGRDFALQGAHLVMVPLTALGTICYIFALKLTTVANVMIVYATMPFVTSAVAYLWTRERPSRRTVVASCAALGGIAVMIGGGANREGLLAGVGLMLVMNVTFALSIVLARRTSSAAMTPVNAFGLLLASAVSFGMAPGVAVGPGSLALMALFGILTIGLAMSLFMYGARTLPAAEVALLGMIDTVLGPVLVWMAFGENPGLAAVAGGIIVLGALVWTIWSDARATPGVGPARLG